MFWSKMMKDKRGINPLLLKLGVALAISFAGFLYSHIRTRRISSTSPPPSSPHSPSQGQKKINSGSSSSIPTFKDVGSILQENIKESPRQTGTMDASSVGLTSSNTDSGDEDGFLLPEFNDLVLEEFEVHSNNSSISPRKDVDRSVKLKIALDKETEKEVHNLRNMIHILRERERKLEMQLLEYYGLKEQETAVMELQNRLKINSVESKLFNLKIESLQADKRRLEAQVADQSNVMAELESARAKIKMLKRKIRLDEEHTRERLSHLQHKVANLQDQEISAVNDLDTQKRLQRLEELEGESAELRIANSRLQYENSELARRLESTQILATSVLELPESEALQEANHQLKKENEDLAKEIEQLQANRCTDVEELVYLRWVNACLRYELRNYKGPPGKTVARDLSKNLSPKSEEKAKRLIVEYANSEGNGDKGILDFDSEYWSSSQNSSHAELSELDDSSFDVSYPRTNSSSRSKVFSKLRKLLHGKHSPKHNHSSVDRSPTSYAASGRRESISTSSFEEMRTCSASTGSSHQDSSLSTMDSTGLESRFEEHNNKMVHRSQSMSRASLDTPLRPRRLSLECIKEGGGMRRNSDIGSSFLYKRMILKEESDSGLGNDSQVEKDLASEKLELMKFAEALKGSNISPITHRSSSYRLF
ncbi:Chup1 protein [Thalictrum thalictroides]|uniref:Chup1 protein n=1 Tax=Thalictrum thalictroides TaxID=46969 RepID=A0A7J6W6E9_THATH|nr:Chup1 protein [Thalictrum thalictroides]